MNPNTPPFFWLGQLAVLLVWGLAWFIAPAWSLSVLTGGRPAVPAEIDQLRMSAPYLLGLAGFTVFALMTRRTVMRRGFASVFSAVFVLWALVNWFGIGAGHYGAFRIVLGWAVLLLGLLNLAFAIPRPEGYVRAEDAGTSDTKPPQAFVLWLVQGVVLGGGALAFLFAGKWVLSVITAPDNVVTPVAIHQTRLLGVFALGVTLFSFHAMTSPRGFAWRGYAFFFSFFLVFWTVSIALILIFGSYASPVFAVLIPGLLFLPMNVRISRMHGEFDPGDYARTPPAWTVPDLAAGPIMGLSTLQTRRRSSHLLGVGAKGRFVPASALPSNGEERPDRIAAPPPNEFFTPGGAPRPIQVRFANLTELDDAALDVRGCAVKFSDREYESPLDLLMNTGSYCPAFNLLTFAGFVASKFVPERGSEAVVRKNLIAREGGVAGLRRAPDSYSHLKFYGQIVRYWIDTTGERHLVRYRCVPEEPVEESGLPDDEDASHIWLRARRADESRPTDYLRQELRTRLGEGPVRLKLEAQFHTPRSGDSLEWFNPSVDWDAGNHPWCELGVLELDEALSDQEAELLQFDPGNHPEILGIPRSTGPRDYRSMGDSEPRVVRALQRLRLWMYGAYGMPTFGQVVQR